MRKPTARPTDTRARILAAASDALIEGQGEIEMTDIARRAGVSVGLAYHYFGSKAGLLGALIAAFYDRYDAVANKRYDGRIAWAARERDRLVATIDFLYTDPMAAIMLGKLGGSAEVGAVDVAWQRETIALAERNIAEGQRRGAIGQDVEPAIAGAAIIGGIRQAVYVALAADPRPSSEALARQLWRFIVGGIALKDSET